MSKINMNEKTRLPSEEEEIKWLMGKQADIKDFLIYVNQLKLITKYIDLKKKKTIVEYGCGNAALLSLIKLFSPNTEIYGVEASKTLLKYIPQEIRKNIFNICCGDKIPLKDKTVDIIVSFDMIEHVPDWGELTEMVKEWDRILKDRGFCIVATPNCNKIMNIIYFLSGKKWIYNDWHHPTPFVYKKLNRLLKTRFTHIKNLKGYDFNFFTKLLSKIGIYKHLCIIARK